MGWLGKCQKYLHDLIQTFPDIRALTVMNMFQIIATYLYENIVPVEPGTGSRTKVGRLIEEHDEKAFFQM